MKISFSLQHFNQISFEGVIVLFWHWKFHQKVCIRTSNTFLWEFLKIVHACLSPYVDLHIILAVWCKKILKELMVFLKVDIHLNEISSHLSQKVKSVLEERHLFKCKKNLEFFYSYASPKQEKILWTSKIQACLCIR